MLEKIGYTKCLIPSSSPLVQSKSISIMTKTILLLCIACYTFAGFSQSSKPKLVIGVVVDQMRAEYLYRFQENYTENGFKKLIREGYNLKNTHYNYIPTATAPGHTTIYTGTTPANHGIIGNSWYDRKSDKLIYCAEDFSVEEADYPLNRNAKNNAMYYARSPKNLMVSTITDEIKLASNGRAKVIGLSLKDRGAIFPAGHLADYAFWYDIRNGNFSTSSYYTSKLPSWLVDFNRRQIPDSLLNLTWEPFLPIERYTNSTADNVSFEKIFKGNENSTFPYDLKGLRSQNGDFGMLMEVPFGNSLLTRMALTTIKEEKLGEDAETDFLTISYSSTDYVGHTFGIRSMEIDDTYIRLDRELEGLLNYLDLHIGKENYLLFLTADHGASDFPKYRQEKKLSGNFYDLGEIKKKLDAHLCIIFGEQPFIAHVDYTELYLVNELEKREEILKEVGYYLSAMIDGINEVFIPSLPTLTFRIENQKGLFENSHYNGRSGDVHFYFKPGWMAKKEYGTTHCNPWASDTHVPLLWYGNKIKIGSSVKKHTVTQIAATLSMLLDIPLPEAADHQPMAELFR